MFVKDAGINGFLEKRLLKSQKSALNAKALIGIRQERMKGKMGDNMKQDQVWFYWNDLPNEILSNFSTLTEENKTELLNKWLGAIGTKSTQKPEQKLENIKDLPAIKIIVPEWVMDRLKEASNHYVNGEWLSTIAISATISEFLTYYLLERYISENGIDEIIKHNKKLGSQDSRLKLLKDLNVLSEANWKLLDEIRDIRNKYIHLNKIDFAGSVIKNNCLKSIKNLIEFLNNQAEQLSIKSD